MLFFHDSLKSILNSRNLKEKLKKIHVQNFKVMKIKFKTKLNLFF